MAKRDVFLSHCPKPSNSIMGQLEFKGIISKCQIGIYIVLLYILLSVTNVLLSDI